MPFPTRHYFGRMVITTTHGIHIRPSDDEKEEFETFVNNYKRLVNTENTPIIDEETASFKHKFSEEQLYIGKYCARHDKYDNTAILAGYEYEGVVIGLLKGEDDVHFCIEGVVIDKATRLNNLT